MLDKDQCVKIMKKRGYESVSHNESGGQVTAINFIKYLKDELAIHAKVTLKSESVSLYFMELKYFCRLSAENFAFDHKDFEKYEQIIMMYAAKCLDIDVFAVLDNWRNEVANDGVTENVKTKKTVKERKRELWDKVVSVGKEKNYDKKTCLDFYNYWTEMNDGGKKLRFEMQKIFDVKKRLNTWVQKEAEFKPAWKQKEEKKVEKQEAEITAWKPVAKHKDLF